ncbi:MAG: formylglycine-generating enzyme family protein [Planctomycetia bacterium]
MPRAVALALLVLLAGCGVLEGRASQPAPVGPSKPGPAWARGVSEAQRREAARLGVPVAYEEPVAGMRFVLVPGGSFTMGSPEGEEGRHGDEGPQQRVTLARFYLSVHEVTNAQYRKKEAGHDSGQVEAGGKAYRLDGPQQPVVLVDHEEAREYASWLTARSEAGQVYALPSEAQWEYACRAGTSARWSFGDRLSDLPRHGNFADRLAPALEALEEWRDDTVDDGHAVAAPVGSYPANAWGLHDMHGNVWEWCADDWHESYAGAPADGRAWIDSPRAAQRVLRGGSWSNTARSLRSAHRAVAVPSGRGDFLGFRLARAVTAQ